MDAIWKNAVKKMRARELRDAAVEPTPTAPASMPGSTTLHEKLITTTTPNWCNPETVTLEQIDDNSYRLQRDWPKEDGIPFPAEMLEMLRALRVAVTKQDAERSTVITPVQTVQIGPPESMQPAANTILKKAEKKRRLREKRAAANTTVSPTVIAIQPTTITIISNTPNPADCSPTQIGANTTTASPTSVLPHISHDTYNTTQPERLYTSLITTTAVPPYNAIDSIADQRDTVTKPFEPADYRLEDIEEVLRKVRKRYRNNGLPIPESIQENAEALRRAVRARDSAVPIQMTTTPTQTDTATTSPAPPTTTTTTTTNSNTANEQDNEEPVERDKGQERRIEGGEGATEREGETRDMGEWERVEETQNEVRDPTPLPTACAVSDTTTLHEPAQFEGVAEVHEAPGLSPVTHDTPQPKPVDPAPAPINPVPGDASTDPDRTAHTSAAPASPINPDPGEAAVNPAGTARTRTVPTDPTPVDPAPYPTSTTTGLTEVVTPTTVEQYDTKGPEYKEHKESTEGEENRDEEKAKREATKEVCPQTGTDGATRHQPFDWATDIDQSIGPVPNASDFCPTKPPSPLASPKPAPRLPDNSVTPSQPIRARTPAPTDCTPAAYTMPAAHAPRDLSGLQSGVQNPWRNLSRRRPHIYPPRDLSGLKSGTRNPWSSINHRRRRFHPPRECHPFSSPEQLRQLPDLHSSTHPQQGKPTLRKPHLESPQLSPQPPVPAYIVQNIQHPHGISSTKPKITKTIPTTPIKFQKNTQTARCACGNIIPAHSPDQRSWRTDTRDTRFRRRFRSLWDRERGRSHVWGGHL